MNFIALIVAGLASFSSLGIAIYTVRTHGSPAGKGTAHTESAHDTLQVL